MRVGQDLKGNDIVVETGGYDNVVNVGPSERVQGVTGIWLVSLESELGIVARSSVIEYAVSIEVCEALET
jgi:hypothetical protein